MQLSPLFTDLYQLTMAEAYFKSGRHEASATFEIFFRKCPFKGEYAIAAGHNLVADFVQNFRFTEEDISYLRAQPQFKHASEQFFEYLIELNLKDLEINGIREGSLVFPRVPLLQIRGPILKAQLLESALLNAMNFSSLVATYARRLRIAAHSDGVPRKLIEFGMRRAQGPNGAITASRSSYLGGFDATSNVLAAKTFHIPPSGTMAHSFVQSFRSLDEIHLNDDFKKHCTSLSNLKTNEGELAAFLIYAQTHPDQCLLLVDTYDTLSSGIPNAIAVFKILKALNHKPLGIRLDSGDLGYLSREARRILDDAGFKEVQIIASNELDEFTILSLQDQGAMLDAYGVGTHLVTAAEDPALGGVYKLVEVDGHPRMKISQQTEKLVLPGAKQIYRLYGESGLMILDLISLQTEEPPQAGHEILALHPSDPYKRVVVTPSRVEALLVPLFRRGEWLKQLSLTEARSWSLEQMKTLRPDISRRINPGPYKVSITSRLKSLLDELYLKEKPVSILR